MSIAASGKFFQIRPGVKARYLKKSEDTLICALAQKTYGKALLCRIRTERILLDKLIALLEKRPVSALWTRYKNTRQKLIRPATLSDEAYAKKWSAVHYKKMGFKEDESVIQTASGIRMRSKSELLIATFEEKEHPLNIAEVTSKLTHFLETLKKGGV